MDKLKRPGVWIPMVVILALITGIAVTYLALKGTKEDKGFIARGMVSALGIGVDGFTPAAQNCVITTVRGLTVKEGMPVTITLDDEVVGTGVLSMGQYKSSPPLSGSCTFPFIVPVSKAAEAGESYEVEVGDMKTMKSSDE
jgi:hypothetical protein